MSDTEKNYKVAAGSIAAGLIIALLMGLVFSLGAFEPLELKTLDHRFERYASRLTPSDDIVIVTIDQNSLDYLQSTQQIQWQWPRDIYAYTIDFLASSGAKAVLLDFDFSNPDINRAEFEEGQTDAILGEAMQNAGTVITSALFDPSKDAGKYADDTVSHKAIMDFGFDLKLPPEVSINNAVHVFAPIDPILQGGRFMGASNAYTDIDGTIRKLSLFQAYGGRYFPSTALATAMTALEIFRAHVDDSLTLKLGERKMHLDTNGEIYLNWYGPGGPESNTFKYYPIANVFLSQISMLNGQDPLLPQDTFKDKIVLIGSNAASLYDLKPTPLSGQSPYPGVEIIATAINNILDTAPLRRESSSRAFLTILVFCLISSIALKYTKSPARSVPLAIAIMGIYYLYTINAFYNNLIVNIVPVETGIVLSFMSAMVINYLTEGREKARVKKAFSQYTSSALMDEILKNPKMLKLGGEKRELSILFSDIRSFTTISENLEPEQLTHVLNEYLTPMTDIVFRHKGILDKYIGDAVMAIFGAPLPLENHAEAACRAALDMIDDLEILKARWRAEDMPDFIQNMKIGVGINSGPVSVGNMGSHLRFDYTVIGDNVNLSSRLESTTKSYGVDIIISEYTWAQVSDKFICRELDYIKVVGKNVPIKIYQLLCAQGQDDSARAALKYADEFHVALTLYRNRQFKEAAGKLADYSRAYPDDKAAETYALRCDQFLELPPPEDWDGVFERREK